MRRDPRTPAVDRGTDKHLRSTDGCFFFFFAGFWCGGCGVWARRVLERWIGDGKRGGVAVVLFCGCLEGLKEGRVAMPPAKNRNGLRSSFCLGWRSILFIAHSSSPCTKSCSVRSYWTTPTQFSCRPGRTAFEVPFPPELRTKRQDVVEQIASVSWHVGRVSIFGLSAFLGSIYFGTATIR